MVRPGPFSFLFVLYYDRLNLSNLQFTHMMIIMNFGWNIWVEGWDAHLAQYHIDNVFIYVLSYAGSYAQYMWVCVRLYTFVPIIHTLFMWQIFCDVTLTWILGTRCLQYFVTINLLAQGRGCTLYRSRLTFLLIYLQPKPQWCINRKDH